MSPQLRPQESGPRLHGADRTSDEIDHTSSSSSSSSSIGDRNSNGVSGGVLRDASLPGRHRPGPPDRGIQIQNPGRNSNPDIQQPAIQNLNVDDEFRCPPSVDDPRLVRSMGIVWCMTLVAVLASTLAAVLFPSGLYFDPITGTGLKTTFLGWFDATSDHEEHRVDLHTATERGWHARVTADTPHAELANPAFFVLWMGLPLLMAAVAYDLMGRFHEGSRRRSELWHLRWVRRPWRRLRRRVLGTGEFGFVLLMVLTNVLVLVVAATTQFRRAMTGWDLDHHPTSSRRGLTPKELRANGLKALGNAFGYSALASMGLVVLMAARPVSDFLVTDVFGLSPQRGRVYMTRLGIWIGLATVIHLAFYVRAYTSEGLLKTRLAFPFTPRRQLANLDEEEDRDLVAWIRARDGYLGWSILFGEIATVVMAVMAVVAVFKKSLQGHSFEAVYTIQRLGAMVVVVTVHLHFGPTIWWLLGPLTLLFVNYISKQANRQRPTRVIDFAPLRNGISRLVLAASHALDQSSDAGSLLVGRFVYVCIPSVRRCQWHPVYIASAPTAARESISLYIKSVGRWSQGVHEHAELCRRKKCTPLVFVDGYYGTPASDRLLSASYVILVGVGDRHAPYVLSAFQELLALYANHDLPPQLRKVLLLWTTDNLCFLKELEPMLRELRKLDPHGDVFEARLHLTTEPRDEDLEAFTDRQPLAHFAEKQFAASRIHSSRSPDPFHRALYSSNVYQVATKLVVFLVSISLLYIVRHQARQRHWWGLVRVMELGMVTLGGFVGYLLVFLERRMISAVVDELREDHGADPMTVGERRVEERRMVSMGFEVIDSYEYESGIGFIEEYGIHVQSKPPAYGQLAELLPKAASRKEDLVLMPNRTPVLCIEIAATEAIARGIEAEFRASNAPNMEIHLEAS